MRISTCGKFHAVYANPKIRFDVHAWCLVETKYSLIIYCGDKMRFDVRNAL